MCATLTRPSPVLTRPTYSSISFGLVPAASTRDGDPMSFATYAPALAGSGWAAPLGDAGSPAPISGAVVSGAVVSFSVIR
jgi:hypothetical protein